MTITYHAGRRIQATQADFDGTLAVSGGWKELDRQTLGSAGDTINVTGLADKRYLMILGSKIPSGSSDLVYRFNADANNNYCIRFSDNYGSDGASTGQGRLVGDNGGSTTPSFQVGFVANKSDREKLFINNAVGQNGTSAGDCPVSREAIGKWTNTSNSISSVQGIQQESGADFASGSEVVVLGWDPDDTHTDNFWEPLASVNGDGSSTNLSSGTLTAKKYLWVQAYTQTSNAHKMTFNNDNNNNYARRWGANGGSENLNASQNGIGTQWTTTTCFLNMFIANISGQQKLILGNDVERNSTGAGNPPYRFNFVGKWTGTDQITEIDFNKVGNFTSTDYIKVWGSN